ncbi:ankyrin repeat domain-containing protein [Candidatus Methylopumilus turicensis]|jgi:ankyrin repeat protein|uniref:Ankyrin n=1 Tax=Candidatus Methylopumilus turicensis TaxID=1581680 RepID=A0A0B7ITQ5_9PROT|nr:ankyrin repeat domain-containing protein [Candidatus Methylopumilus turicensis]CEN55645.1 Ankyrin [Candidatus Methylopumilus turicensis]
MKMIKALMMVIALSIPFAAFAMEGEQQVDYTEALRDGNVKKVKKYIDSGVDVNEKFFAWSALQISANKNQLGVVKYLVEHGADVNYTHPLTKMSAIQMAAYDGYTEIVKYLASKGADLNLKLKGDVSIVRVVRDTGNTKMVDLLLSLGAKDDGCKEEKCF